MVGTTDGNPGGDPVARENFLRLQRLTLMEQARLHDLSHRAGRRQSAVALQGLFRDLQTVLQPQFTLEIGAHVAPFSQEMARRGIEAHAFEANPHNYQAFARRIARRAPGVRYYNLAVTDIDGETTFKIRLDADGQPRRIAGNNSLLPLNDSTSTYETVTVPACRLDSFLSARGLSGRTFSAWIDVEGALGKVTAGFGSALRSCLSLIVEVEERRFWQDQMLAADVMAYLDSQGMVPIARDFEFKDQFNLVYIREDLVDDPNLQLALSGYLSISHVAELPSASR